jgi:hypothetical protein
MSLSTEGAKVTSKERQLTQVFVLIKEVVTASLLKVS